MTRLSVNLNAVAYVRNRRDVPWPDVGEIARVVLDAGAGGITVHPRPDQRHIRFSDLPVLSKVTKSHSDDTEFNIEGYPTEELYGLIMDAQPNQVTLVPDDPSQSTSDHGWDMKGHSRLLEKEIQRYKDHGFTVSLFVDPEKENAVLANNLGADRIEIYTGPYGAATNQSEIDMHLKDIAELAAAADALPNLGVNAGHDLTVNNLPLLKKAAPNMAEVFDWSWHHLRRIFVRVLGIRETFSKGAELGF